jgi:hypothetical protein
MECIHGLEFGCTLCSGKDSLLRDIPEEKPNPVLLPRRTGRKDPNQTIAVEVAMGKRCGSCRTLHAPQGCKCSRRAIYDAKLEGAVAAAKVYVDANLITGREGAGIAFGVVKRAGRKAGITHDPQEKGQPSDAEADRLDIIEQFEVEPRWQPYRRTEADHLPV